MAEPAWVRIKSFVSEAGSLCMTCNSLYSRCEHLRVKCFACGAEGLQENWPFNCCSVTAESPPPLEAQPKENR